ncbi:uncharacterized protein LOC141857777 [Brevipalpus obovatus]|uniref:uncharacterized protein LOC141857777 n=1 Tax=Brevipalpus obovatus TaxID=246614 RepID=UPI003D9DBEA4
MFACFMLLFLVPLASTDRCKVDIGSLCPNSSAICPMLFHVYKTNFNISYESKKAEKLGYNCFISNVNITMRQKVDIFLGGNSLSDGKREDKHNSANKSGQIGLWFFMICLVKPILNLLNGKPF